MGKETIQVEADSLEEARAEIASRIPKGQKVLSERVIADGKQRVIRAAAETVEEALKGARSKIPADAALLGERVLSAPRQEDIS